MMLMLIVLSSILQKKNSKEVRKQGKPDFRDVYQIDPNHFINFPDAWEADPKSMEIAHITKTPKEYEKFALFSSLSTHPPTHPSTQPPNHFIYLQKKVRKLLLSPEESSARDWWKKRSRITKKNRNSKSLWSACLGEALSAKYLKHALSMIRIIPPVIPISNLNTRRERGSWRKKLNKN